MTTTTPPGIGSETPMPTSDSDPKLLETITPTGWIVLALGLVLVAAAVVTDYRELLAFGLALVLALILAGVWMSLHPSLEINRVLAPSRVEEGDLANAVLTVENLGRRRTTPMLVEEQFGPARLPVPIDSLGSQEHRSITYEVPTARRGRYSVGPLRVAHTDPLRLMRVGRTQGAITSLYVLPRTHKVAPLPTGRIRDLEGSNSARTAQGGVTFHTLREYVPGDDLRLVHWRSTARVGKLMVRHNVVTFEPRFSILLDTWEGSYDTQERFENAVRVAASLVDAAVNIGHEVTFLTSGGFKAHIDATGNGRARVFDLMAEAEVAEDDPSLAALALTVDTRKQPVSLGVITGEPRSADVEIVARAGSRFDSVTVIQMAESGVPMPIGGAMVLRCEDSSAFVNLWKQRVG